MATSSRGESSSTPRQEINMAVPVPSIPQKICRVNAAIRAANPGEYTPQRVSIGALHPETSDWMKKEKKTRLDNALSIPDHEQADEKYHALLTGMASNMEKAQQYYIMPFRDDSNKQEFANNLLLDGYFVLSHFLERTEARWCTRQVLSDTYNSDVIFLFENQVPFFILEEIYRLLNKETAEPSGGASSAGKGGSVSVPPSFSSSSHPSPLQSPSENGEAGAPPAPPLPKPDNKKADSFVLDEIAKHIKTLIKKYVHESVNKVGADQPQPCHLVHLLHMYFRPVMGGAAHVQADIERNTIPLPHQNDGSGNDVEVKALCRSAAHYHNAGVTLARRKLDGINACSILDVKLSNGTLQIPRLEIDNRTFMMLRNMVALEQHCHGMGSHVTIYCYFMSHLANTEEDVRLLEGMDILFSHISNKGAVADSFANICTGVMINLEDPIYNYMKSIMVDLEKLCKRPWGKSKAWLRQHKCDNRIKTIISVVAIIVTICTLEQSVFAALSYFLKK